MSLLFSAEISTPSTPCSYVTWITTGMKSQPTPGQIWTVSISTFITFIRVRGLILDQFPPLCSPSRSRWLKEPDAYSTELFRMVADIFILWCKSHVSFFFFFFNQVVFYRTALVKRIHLSLFFCRTSNVRSRTSWFRMRSTTWAS